MKLDEIKKLLNELVSKKYVANILVLLAIAIIALIFTSDFFTKDPLAKNVSREAASNSLVEAELFKGEEELVEARLKQILEKIKGCGEVEVMVTFEMGPEIIPASNIVENKDLTEEADASGGIRTVRSENITENIVTSNSNSGSMPLVLKEIKPKVRGVIVVAQGGDNVEVKKQLYEAVKTVLQVSGDRVQIYAKN